MLPVDPQEPSFEWDCKPCAFEQPQNQEGKSWGFYDVARFGCEACKEKCNKDEKCSAIQCYGDQSSDYSELSSRSGLRQCMWLGKSIAVSSQECDESFAWQIRCTKKYTRK